MTGLLELYLSSDYVVFGSPVYTWNMTACLKNFVDRLIPLRSPLLQQSNGNFDMQKLEIKFPQVVVIANSGFPGEKNFGLMHEVFKSGNPVLEIYRNSGHALKSENPEVKKKVDFYLQNVENAGFELVTNGSVSENVKSEIDKELVTTEEYLKLLGMK